MEGVLPATLRVALRSKIAPGDFVNFRPLPPGVYKYLLLIGILEAPVDLGAQQLIPDLD